MGDPVKIRLKDLEPGLTLPVDIQTQPVQIFASSNNPAYVTINSFPGVYSFELTDADETVAQYLEATRYPASHWCIFVQATTATNVYVKVKSGSGKYYLLDSASSVTDYSKTFTAPFQTVRVETDAAGVAGDTVSIFIRAQ